MPEAPIKLSDRPVQSRAATVTSVLRHEILSGQYRSGERLPSERDLCDRFGVSRGVVREALKQLQQLGIASIQPGGARVVPVAECTLDVLGPLLDLREIPEPKLVDEVMQMLGVLMREAAQAAMNKASDEQIVEAERIIDEILSHSGDDGAQFESVRKLGGFFIEVADHLVLRLMINGLRTTFIKRMIQLELEPTLDRKELAATAERIRQALVQRNAKKLGAAMQDLNRLFREGARVALESAEQKQPRI